MDLLQVGNPATNHYYDSKGLAEYAWSHAIVSDEVYSRIKKHCDFKISNWSDGCNAAMDILYGQYQEIDMYNIYAPKCLLNQSSASSANFVNDQVKYTCINADSSSPKVFLKMMLIFGTPSAVQEKDTDVLWLWSLLLILSWGLLQQAGSAESISCEFQWIAPGEMACLQVDRRHIAVHLDIFEYQPFNSSGTKKNMNLSPLLQWSHRELLQFFGILGPTNIL